MGKVEIHRQHFIDGAWTDSHGDSFIDVVNPATEQVLARVPAGDESDATSAVLAARRAFNAWSTLDLDTRLMHLRRVLVELKSQRDTLIETVIEELGAPRKAAADAQVDLPLEVFERICDLAPGVEVEWTIENVRVLREPIGVVSCITPWNYPLHQVIVKVVAAMAMGCTVVLKPSEVTPISALMFADAFARAGFPEGVFNLVIGTGPMVGEVLASHAEVDMVSFTGSTRAGIRVSELAATTVKRVSLELGGKSASIILPSADLDEAVKRTIASCFENSGQACSALTRLLVPQHTLPAVEDIAAVEASSYMVGDPRDESTVLGPLVNAAQRDRVTRMVKRAVEQGGRVIIGDQTEPVTDTGYFFPPTVISDIRPDMEIARDEVFGPVLVLIGYESVDEAVRIANDTDYGLSGAVWAADDQEASQIARQLRTGQVIINGGGWNFLAPFGGYKKSGLGRESGTLGMEEFLEIKALRL